MKKYQLASLLWLISSMQGQNLVDVRTQTKNVDFSGAASTIPAKSGSALPATCSPGEMFFKTNNTPGQNLYGCAPANTWTLLSGTVNGTVTTANGGQFAFYAANGAVVSGHTLTASDIPALNYQTPLTLTGNGSKTASSTGTLLNNDCAKWDANGNIIDSGSPCASVAMGSAGQFGFYSASGNALAAHTLAASDIPQLSYFSLSNLPTLGTAAAAPLVATVGTPGLGTNVVSEQGIRSAITTAVSGLQTTLSFTGNGPKTVSSTAAGASGNCVKWDANGNVIDAGNPCSSFSALNGTNTSGTLSIGSGATLAPTGTGSITANNLRVFTNVSNCPTNAGGIGYLTTELGICGGNGSSSWFGTYWLSTSTPPTTNHFAMWANSSKPGQQSDTGLSPSGNGTSVVTALGTLTGGNCAKFDGNGNIIDAGAPCGSGGSAATWSSLAPGTNTSGAFVLGTGASLLTTGTGTIAATSVPAAGITGSIPYSSLSGTPSLGSVVPESLVTSLGSPGVDTNVPSEKAVRSAIAALSYQSPLTFTGSGSKTVSSTAAGTSGNCAKWDAAGNVADAGAPCGTGGSAATWSSLTPGTNTAGSFLFGSGASLSATGTGTITATSVPAAGITGSLPYSSLSGTPTLGTVASAALVTAVGSTGLDTNVGSEKAIRTAISTAIAALSYQSPLTFTGSGSKTVSATAAGSSGNCAKWDASGNVSDAGAPCGTSGGSSAWAALTPGTNTSGSFILGSGASLSATGTGTIAATSVPAAGISGSLPYSSLSGTPTLGSVASASIVTSLGSPGVDTNVASEKAVRSAIASLNYQSPLSFTGTGSKTVSSTAAGTSGNCAKWDAVGNVIDSGAPCTTGFFSTLAPGTNTSGSFVFGSGASVSASGTGTIAATSVPAAGIAGSIPYSSLSGTPTLGTVASAALVTAVGSTGLDTNVASEKAIRTAISNAIAALNYQAPLTFTGSGSKTISATAAGTSGNCAKWDAAGNVSDAGAPCGTGGGSSAWASLTPGTNTAGSFILGSGAALSATGTGTIAATSVPAAGVTGSLPYSSLSGTPTLGSVASASIVTSLGSPGVDTNVASEKAVRSAISSLSYQSPLTFTGTGSKTVSSTAAGTSGNCVKWDAVGNVIDSGAPCTTGFFSTLAPGTNTLGAFVFGSGASLSASGTGTIAATSVPASGISGSIAYSSLSGAPTLGSVASTTLVTSLGSPGTDGNVASEKAVRTAIAALSYQAPLSFTGTGSKTVSSTVAGTSGNCAKWDAAGNVIDSGAPCTTGSFSTLTPGTNTLGSFVFGSGSSLSATGTGTIAATSVPASGIGGSLPYSSLSGTPTLGSVASASLVTSVGSPGIDTNVASEKAIRTAISSAITALNYQAPSFTGSGSKTVSSTAAGVSGNCAKWDASGNVIDAGAPCGSGGGGGISAPASTTVGNVPQYSNTTGTALSAGLGVVTSVGSPGSDSNLPTEKSVRTAIAAASAAAGNLPAQTGSAGYLVTNGTTASWGNIATGASGALDCATVTGVCDVVTSVVPLKASANTFTGVNKFSRLQVTIFTVATLPTCNSSFEGQMEGVSDAVSPGYLAAIAGGGSVHVPVYCNGTTWVAY